MAPFVRNEYVSTTSEEVAVHLSSAYLSLWFFQRYYSCVIQSSKHFHQNGIFIGWTPHCNLLYLTEANNDTTASHATQECDISVVTSLTRCQVSVSLFKVYGSSSGYVA